MGTNLFLFSEKGRGRKGEGGMPWQTLTLSWVHAWERERAGGREEGGGSPWQTQTLTQSAWEREREEWGKGRDLLSVGGQTIWSRGAVLASRECSLALSQFFLVRGGEGGRGAGLPHAFSMLLSQGVEWTEYLARRSQTMSVLKRSSSVHHEPASSTFLDP